LYAVFPALRGKTAPRSWKQEGAVLNIVNVGYDSTNYYVIETAPTKLLVDVGFPGTLPKLRHALKRTGIALSDINYLLATHYHPDHAGLVQEVKRQGIKLIVLEHQTTAIPVLKQHMKPSQQYLDITLDDNITISTDESRAFLHRIGIDGQIIATPGHSDDSITLILDAGIAFTGDLPPTFMADHTTSATQRSWDAIHSHHVTAVYPGHGPIRQIAELL
jgi:glyoxylase-like metal-dependent hydrolase (beta-lactamase superfamily II)